MFKERNAGSRQFERLIDFVALGATFYISALILSVETGSSLIFYMLTYSTILLVFVRLSKRTIASCYKLAGKFTRQIFGNAIGIVIGACIMLLLEKSLPFHTEFSRVIVLSSVMVFFILGTLGPLAHTALVHRCRGNYDFDRIAFFAKRRFIDGFNAVELLEQAESTREKEEIALVCSLDVENDKIRELQLCCTYSQVCKVIGCRTRLKEIIEKGLDQRAFA